MVTIHNLTVRILHQDTEYVFKFDSAATLNEALRRWAAAKEGNASTGNLDVPGGTTIYSS